METVLAAMVHASSCIDAVCPTDHCSKMKRVIAHVKNCPKGGHTQACPVCKQFVTVAFQHARTCQAKMCSVPFCLLLRQRMMARNRNKCVLEAQPVGRLVKSDPSTHTRTGWRTSGAR